MPRKRGIAASFDLDRRKRRGIRPKEIEKIFSDELVNWTEVLSNEEYEVFDAESENEAEKYAEEIFQREN